jgi:hypothetical protein
MKNLFVIFVLLLIYVLGMSQATQITVPNYNEWVSIYSGRVGIGGDGLDTTSNISLKQSYGVGSLCIEVDTTGAAIKTANRSDSCLIVGIQFYCAEANAGGWGPYFNNVDTYKSVTNFTIVDTLDRAYAGGGNSRYFLDLSTETVEWLWADYARFFLIIGYGDSLYIRVAYGGQ